MADFHHGSNGEPVSQVVQDPLDAARAALQRHEWLEGYELLHAADESMELGPEDVLLLAEAAMWAGHIEDVMQYLERAYRGYLREGKTLRAAYVATWIAHDQRGNLQIGGIDGNERPWHESVTGRGQKAWLSMPGSMPAPGTP